MKKRINILDAQPGYRVKCLRNKQPFNDQPYDDLVVGKEYNLESIDVGDSMSWVRLEGLPSTYNSILFQVVSTGKPSGKSAELREALDKVAKLEKRAAKGEAMGNVLSILRVLQNARNMTRGPGDEHYYLEREQARLFPGLATALAQHGVPGYEGMAILELAEELEILYQYIDKHDAWDVCSLACFVIEAVLRQDGIQQTREITGFLYRRSQEYYDPKLTPAQAAAQKKAEELERKKAELESAKKELGWEMESIKRRREHIANLESSLAKAGAPKPVTSPPAKLPAKPPKATTKGLL